MSYEDASNVGCDKPINEFASDAILKEKVEQKFLRLGRRVRCRGWRRIVDGDVVDLVCVEA